jgi:uncharacterized protein (DUF1330 family)
MAHFLVIKAWCPHRDFLSFVQSSKARFVDFELFLCAPVHHVMAVEPGSMPAHLWVGRFASAAAVDEFWAQSEAAEKLAHEIAPIALSLPAVPASGLGDFIPTAANVPARGDLSAPGLLVIEGSATDQARMDQYRDILLPLMRDFGAFYIAFELGGNVQVLSGKWSEAIFAISQWPSMDSATAMWLSGRYQNDAIPLRLGVGHFSVLLATGYTT